MVDIKLAENGWTEERVEPGNCVQARWSREHSGLRAVITKTKDGVEGVIKAAEEAANAKRKGELTLKELESPEAAAAIMDKLMESLSIEAPHKEEERLFVKAVSSS